MTASPKVAAVSIGPAGDDRMPLWFEAEAGIRTAADAGALLAVLPELFAQPYVAGDDPGPLGASRRSHRGRDRD